MGKRLACNACKTPIETNSTGLLYCPVCEPEQADKIAPDAVITCPECNNDIAKHFKTYPQLLFGNCPNCGYKLGKTFR